MGSDSNTSQEIEFVLRRFNESLPLGIQGVPPVVWLLIFLGAAVLALLFIALRYASESKAVGDRLALVRGGLRLLVGVLLATVFLAGWFFGEAFRTQPLLWWWVFVPLVVLGLAYVVWMYTWEVKTIGAWALPLAGLRVLVYGFLAVVFLLPAWQTWDVSESRSKVVLLLDVSGSMDSKDDLPTDTMPVEKLLSRQDKVIQFLTDAQVAFLKKLQDKNPVTAYRVGGQLDEDFRLFADGKEWSTEEWNAWLKPNVHEEMAAELDEEAKAKFRKKMDLLALLVNSTNLTDSVLSVLNRESNNMLQGIIVVSDGRSTQFSTETFETVKKRAADNHIPIFTVAIGEHRQPIKIGITEVQAPDQARPDDKFPIRVGVDGDGLAGQPVDVTLEVTKPNGEKDVLKPNLPAGEVPVFKPGEPPHAQIEFEVDKPVIEGEWKFVARVPKDKREIFAGKEHVTDPTTVQVVKKPLRVLLVAGGPTHEYQFVRTLFVREMDKKRAKVSIHIQLARPEIVQDIPQERLLTRFPSSIRAVDDPNDTADTKYDNLAQYDLIVAFDVDWTLLTPEQLRALEQWVSGHAGGLVVVAGMVNTFQLARGVNYEAVKPILDLLPVYPDDSRLQGLGVERSTAEPWPLNFPGASNEMEFLKLDEDSKEPIAGWKEFFAGSKGGAGGGRARGFYNYYPVKGAKANATVVATFTDPRARLTDGKEQPFLVTMPYGSGKVVYIGSGEMWRLRQCREVYHERFWTKLGRYASSGTLNRQSSRGDIYMADKFTAQKYVNLQARLRNRDMQPLERTAKPVVLVKPPAGVTLTPNKFELHAKPGQGDETAGWFEGRFLALAPGNYEIQLLIPGTPDVLSKKFDVKEANPELDNTQPDFVQLRQLASDAKDVLGRFTNEEVRDKLKRTLERTNKTAGQVPGDEKETLRLYFDLKSAAALPEFMVAERKTQKIRGPIKDVWDFGFFLGTDDPGSKLSVVMLVVIGLLSLEWLARKLLRLA